MNQKAYAKAVGRQLKCSKAQKKEIMKQLESDIGAALEQGETLEQVCSRMGTPKELAGEFNENLSEEERKQAKKEKAIKITVIIMGIFLVLGLLGYWLFPKPIPIEQSTVFEEEQLKNQTIEVVSALDAKNYEALQSEYADEILKSYLTEEDMEQTKETIGKNWGKQVSLGNQYMTEIHQGWTRYAIVQINVGYENTNVTYTFTFNTEYRLIGLYMK